MTLGDSQNWSGPFAERKVFWFPLRVGRTQCRMSRSLSPTPTELSKYSNYKLRVQRSFTLCILLYFFPQNPVIKMFPKLFNLEIFYSLNEREQFYTLLMSTSPSGLFTPWRKPTLLTVCDADWTADPFGRLWRRKLFCPLSKIEGIFLGPPSRSLDRNTDWDL